MGINYNQYDLDILDEMKPVLKKMKIDISDDDVWKIAKKSDTPPLFENILIQETFKRLGRALLEKYGDNIDIQVNVNARDSSFLVNGIQIFSIQDVKDAMRGSEPSM